MNVEIQRLTPKDTDCFSELIKVFEKVFEWESLSPPTNTYLQRLLNNKSFLVYVAKTNHSLLGRLTVHLLYRYATEKPSPYICDMAVSPQFQRKGIGKFLIASLNDNCKKNGFSEVFVQAEKDDHQAVNFSRTIPNTCELQATHFTYSFDEVNDNVE